MLSHATPFPGSQTATESRLLRLWTPPICYRASTSAPTSRSRRSRDHPTTAPTGFTTLSCAWPPAPAESAHKPACGHCHAGGHSNEKGTWVLPQEKTSLSRELRGVEPELGKQGRVYACRAGSAATDASLEFLLGLLLQPQLARRPNCLC